MRRPPSVPQAMDDVEYAASRYKDHCRDRTRGRHHGQARDFGRPRAARTKTRPSMHAPRSRSLSRSRSRSRSLSPDGTDSEGNSRADSWSDGDGDDSCGSGSGRSRERRGSDRGDRGGLRPQAVIRRSRENALRKQISSLTAVVANLTGALEVAEAKLVASELAKNCALVCLRQMGVDLTGSAPVGDASNVMRSGHGAPSGAAFSSGRTQSQRGYHSVTAPCKPQPTSSKYISGLPSTPGTTHSHAKPPPPPSPANGLVPSAALLNVHGPIPQPQFTNRPSVRPIPAALPVLKAKLKADAKQSKSVRAVASSIAGVPGSAAFNGGIQRTSSEAKGAASSRGSVKDSRRHGASSPPRLEGAGRETFALPPPVLHPVHTAPVPDGARPGLSYGYSPLSQPLMGHSNLVQRFQ